MLAAVGDALAAVDSPIRSDRYTTSEARGWTRQTLSIPFGDEARGNYTATVQPGTSFGTWEGWGTSLCWWAQAFGDRDDLADVFFTMNDSVAVKEGFSVPGLGMTIGRYNAGASSDAAAGGQHMETSPNVSPTRLLQAFWTTWEGSSPGEAGQPPLEGAWDWSADARQRAMMAKAHSIA